MVSVRIPVPVPVLLCGFAVDYEVAAGVVVETSYNIEQGSLSAARGSKNGNKLVLAELHAYSPESADIRTACGIVLDNAVKFKHGDVPFKLKFKAK